MSDQYASWLSAEETAECLGISVSNVTRAAQAGKLRRAKVNNRWRYDPSTIKEQLGEVVQVETDDDSEPKTASQALAPTGESILAGGATMLKASGDLVTRLVDAVLRSQEQQTKLVETISKSMVGVVERLDSRCGKLEELQVDLIKAREEFLSSTTERELATAEAAGNLMLKERAIALLGDNLEPALELAKLLMTKNKETDNASTSSERADMASQAISSDTE